MRRFKDEVVARVKRFMHCFLDFKSAHATYQATLTGEVEIEESEEYFDEVQDSYIESLVKAK